MFGARHDAALVASLGHEPSAVVAVGMSAGALGPLRLLVQALPRNFPGAMVIAHHVAQPSILPSLLSGWADHPAAFARRGMPLARGCIFVCPPEHHIVVHPDATLDVHQRERVDYVRPSIDWLFDTVAASYQDRALGILLSGANHDGARGARRIRESGGCIAIQAPSTASYPAMPLAAAAVAHASLSPAELGGFIRDELRRIELEASPRDWAA